MSPGIGSKPEPDQGAGSSRSPRPQGILGIVGGLALIAVLVALIVPRADEVSDALGRVGIGSFFAVVALGTVALVLRTTAWQVAIDAAGGRLRALEAHLASAVAYVTSLVSPYIGMASRIAVIRNRVPERSPSTSQQLAAESVLIVVEAALVAILLLSAAWTLDISVPLAVLAVIGGLAAVGTLVLAARRLAPRHFGAGLAAAREPRTLGMVTAAIAATLATQLARVALALSAVGMDADPFVVIAVFLASGLGAVIPIGTAATGAAAPLIAASAGAGSVGDASAAGVLMSGALMVSTFGYLGTVAVLAKLPWRGRVADRNGDGDDRGGEPSGPSVQS
jgi:hypothetical protein